MQCGLAQTHCVTVPLRVTLFPISYAALPWCANSGGEKIEIPIPRAKRIKNLPFKSHLLFGGAKACVFSLGPATFLRTGRDSKDSYRTSQVYFYGSCRQRFFLFSILLLQTVQAHAIGATKLS